MENKMEIVILNQAKKISLFEIFFVFYFLYNLKRTFGAKMEHLFQIIGLLFFYKIYGQFGFTFGRNGI
jgi:hypothetical protein